MMSLEKYAEAAMVGAALTMGVTGCTEGDCDRTTYKTGQLIGPQYPTPEKAPTPGSAEAYCDRTEDIDGFACPAETFGQIYGVECKDPNDAQKTITHTCAEISDAVKGQTALKELYPANGQNDTCMGKFLEQKTD